LLRAPPLVHLDNVHQLNAAPLAAVLTTTKWMGRLLGKSQMVEVPNRSTWIATGNNVELSDELARRVNLIRVDAQVDRPEERVGWRHDPLAEWAMTNRTELVSACLSLVQNWVDRGMPSGKQTLGRFEAWCSVLGGILDAAGVEGFLGNRDRVYAAGDMESSEWAELVAEWGDSYEGQMLNAGAVYNILKENDLLMDLWAGKSPEVAAQRVGYALKARRDQVFSGWCLRLGWNAHGKTRGYFVERVFQK